MEIQILKAALRWAEVRATPMHDLCYDWHGQSMDSPAHFSLLEDTTHLWLIAGRNKPAKPHPTGLCGDFQVELWRHDVAELFIAAPDGSAYLEFNLSPRGAWWMERFSQPRHVDPIAERPVVKTHAELADGGAWLSALAIPLDWLFDTIGWSENSPLNVSFILDSPDQRFLTACDLGDGEPDFHRPQAFQPAHRLSG